MRAQRSRATNSKHCLERMGRKVDLGLDGAQIPIATFSRSVSWSLGGAGRKRSRTEAAPAACSLKILCDTS